MEYSTAVKVLQGQVDLQAERLYQLANSGAAIALLQEEYKKYYAQVVELYDLFFESLNSGKAQGQLTTAEHAARCAELRRKFLEQQALVASALDKITTAV